MESLFFFFFLNKIENKNHEREEEEEKGIELRHWGPVAAASWDKKKETKTCALSLERGHSRRRSSQAQAKRCVCVNKISEALKYEKKMNYKTTALPGRETLR